MPESVIALSNRWLNGGKTVIFCEILKSVAAKGKRGIMVVHGKSLVHQCSNKLHREGVEHGVYQANHWNKNHKANIQICSISTLFRRKEVPPADIVVIDEAHFAGSDSFIWLSNQYPNAYFLPVTATPFPVKPITHVASKVVKPITTKELIDLGFLVDARYFAPSTVDLTGVSIDAKTKDYKTNELNTAVSKPALYGDIVSHYKKLSNNLPAICFAVTKDHSRSLVEAFLSQGISAVHVEDSTKDHERQEILRRHESGEIKVICNVGILCTGVDMPYLRTVIMARPTRSTILFVQQMGRGTRPYPGKSNFILLDHAGNIERHGFLTDDREATIDGKEKKQVTVRIVTCEECYFIYSPENKECPECGHVNVKVSKSSERNTKVKDTELVEVQKKSPLDRQIDSWIEKVERNQYNPYWLLHQIKKKYPQENANLIFKSIWNRFSDGTKARRFNKRNPTTQASLNPAMEK